MSEQPIDQPDQPTEITDADLPKNLRDLVLKAKGAVEMKNFKYTISLLQAVLKEAPGYVEGRKLLRKLKVYTGPEHPHQAQQPKQLSSKA